MRLTGRLLPLIALAAAQTPSVECDDTDPHTWWLVVGVLVLVFGLVLAFFGGYYVASTITPTARYTPELPRYTASTRATLNSFAAAPEPRANTMAKSNFTAAKLKSDNVDDSPLDRFNLAAARHK